jgi:hypothetical protein
MAEVFTDDHHAQHLAAPPLSPQAPLRIPSAKKDEFPAANFEKEGFDWLERVHECIMRGVTKYKFKKGAFVDSIIYKTPVIKALNIMLGLSLTTPAEKRVLIASRNGYAAIRRMFPEPQELPAAKDVKSISGRFNHQWECLAPMSRLNISLPRSCRPSKTRIQQWCWRRMC